MMQLILKKDYMGSETNIKANIKQAVPFFWVLNMAASLQFYLDGLGFEMTKNWVPRSTIEWCWLQRGGAALMLQEYRKVTGAAIEKRGGGVSICMQCEDALALYHEFTAKGLPASEPFVGNGMWVTNLTDPDGYSLSFQSPADAPEETTYSDWKK
jgi:lactoylglutathione lyase